MDTKAKLDLVQIRAAMEQEGGRERYWQSLEQLAQTPAYRHFQEREFPEELKLASGEISRRGALKFMAASAAFAGLTACTKLPVEKIVPYVQAPEEIVPGRPLFYASAMPTSGGAIGVLVESHMGRPTKIEGNPQHPASLGATDAITQASILSLYDPDRPQVVTYQGRIRAWTDFLTAVNQLRAEKLVSKGAGMRLLTESVTSPTLADQIQTFLKQFPQAKWHRHEAARSGTARDGARLAFGEYVNTVYRFDQADIVLSLDSNFLCEGPGSVRYARDFADKRRITDINSKMNRLYAIESTPTNTGAMADHRMAVRASDVEAISRAVASKLGISGMGNVAAPAGVPADWIPALVRDLENHKGASIVIAGDQQPPAVHVLAHAMNAALGNAGKTVVYTDPVEADPTDQMQSLRDLVNDIRAGSVDTLIILADNPVFTAPTDLDLRSLLFPPPPQPGAENPPSKVKTKIHLSLYHNETSELCDWHIPECHFLEAWGDARAYDGTVSVIQPLISPLYQSKSAIELMAVLTGNAGNSAHDIIHDYWKGQKPAPDYEVFWAATLHDGVMAASALPEKTVAVKPGVIASSPSPPNNTGQMELIVRPDPTIRDGRFANNGWLQELPKPNTQLTWDNAAMVSVATAERLGVVNGDVVELSAPGRKVNAPIWIMPGHANDCVTIHLGYGRWRAGRLGTGIGFNAYQMRASDTPWIVPGLQVTKTGERYELVSTQFQHVIEPDGTKQDEESVQAFNRDLVRVATLDEFKKNPDFAKDPPERTTNAPSLYPPYRYEGNQWGFAVDLNSCVGCGACSVACQAENNIAVVGKEEVGKGRHMHWIRVDTYFRGDVDKPETYYEPLLCMHCENAPCEGVCPVGATVHSPEGINEMVYNRCVGTRYCSNNCPYKVRRFNFLLYSDWTTPSLFSLRNPNVTVRSRGVMEKCTYCIQRINKAKIASELEDREVRDGEIQTACQQVCPTQALVFGNINDPNSRVSKLKAQSRNYSLVAELNTRPRTTYQARLRNPNPEIKD